jgi:hypothetical protein
VKALIVISVACLAIGLGLLFGYAKGTSGLTFGYPLSAMSVHIDMTTTGVPALASALLTLFAALGLTIACFLALFGGSREREVGDVPPRRREEPFRE